MEHPDQAAIAAMEKECFRPIEDVIHEAEVQVEVSDLGGREVLDALRRAQIAHGRPHDDETLVAMLRNPSRDMWLGEP